MILVNDPAVQLRALIKYTVLCWTQIYREGAVIANIETHTKGHTEIPFLFSTFKTKVIFPNLF